MIAYAEVIPLCLDVKNDNLKMEILGGLWMPLDAPRIEIQQATT